MATTRKNSADEFNELPANDTSFAENDRNDAQLMADPEAQQERLVFSSTPFGDRERPDDLNQELLQAVLSRYPQTDDNIRRIVTEVVSGFARYNSPTCAPADSPEVKQLKARIAVLKGYYPVTWV